MDNYNWWPYWQPSWNISMIWLWNHHKWIPWPENPHKVLFTYWNQWNIDWVMMKNIIGSHLGSHIGFKHPWGTGDASNQLYHVYWLLLSWISERNLWISSPMGLQGNISGILAAILEIGGHIELQTKFKMAPGLISKSISLGTRIHWENLDWISWQFFPGLDLSIIISLVM